MGKKCLKLNSADTVGQALTELKKGKNILCGDKDICLRDDIPGGHKFATENILKGTNILKYGTPIGQSTRDILRGEWIHSRGVDRVMPVESGNVETLEGISNLT